MANAEVVLMRLETRGEPGRRALEELRAQLPDAPAGRFRPQGDRLVVVASN
jgi:DNA-binding NarL/FixJ family response regulator